MIPIREFVDVRANGTHSRFAHQVEPFHVHSDFPWQQGVGSIRNNTLCVVDYDLQCVYAEPINVPFNMGDPAYNGPGSCDPGFEMMLWTPTAANNVPLAYRCNRPLGFQEFDLQVSAEEAPAAMHEVAWEKAPESIGLQGLTVFWSRRSLNNDEGNDADDTNLPFFTVRIHIGSGSEEAIYSVYHTEDGKCHIARRGTREELGEWENIERVSIASDVWNSAFGRAVPIDEEPEGGNGAEFEYHVIEFRLIAGRLAVRMNGQDQVFVYDEERVDIDGNPIWTIDKITVRAFQFRALAWSAHPMCFSYSGQWDSQEIPIGFRSTNVGEPYLDAAGVVPPGSSAYISEEDSNLEGPICHYRLLFDNQVDGFYRGHWWSYYTAAVRAVNLFWLGKVHQTMRPPSIVTPEVVTVSHQFDAGGLTVHSHAQLVMNNQSWQLLPDGSIDFWAGMVRRKGQFAVDIGLARSTRTGTFGPPMQAFAGYGGTKYEIEGQAGASSVIVHCSDRRRQAMSPAFGLPWMDGWNVFYAIAYLAQLRGWALSDLHPDFRALVPPVPFGPGSDLGDGDGGPAYYLPIGEAGSMLTRETGCPVWPLMQKIAGYIGYLLFPDAYGRLVFRKFKLPTGIRRVFFDSDPASEVGGPANAYGGVPGTEGMWSAKVLKNLDDVRSDTIVAGMAAFAPRWNPIVYKYSDDGVVYDQDAYNHLGYRNPAVVVDTMFADEAFADRAAYGMMRFMREPGYRVRFTTWMQPDIYPLDVILVASARLAVWNIPFMVVGTIHEVSQDSGFTTITAQYVPPTS